MKQAYKRVLAEDIVSPIDVPELNVSHLDGYAVHHEDTVSASRDSPTILKLVGSIRLTEKPSRPLMRGEAFKIPTGGFLPPSSNAIVPKESAYEEGEFVKVLEPAKLWDHVVHRGSDIRKGELVLKKGSILRAQDLALLKSLRFKEVQVYRKPVVAILSVGSELTDDPDEAKAGKVLRSHELLVKKLVEEAGGLAVDLGIVIDEKEKITEKLKDGLGKASMVLTIGGSSKGEADLVPDSISSLGKPGMLVHGLKVQPGRVSGFGCVEGKPIILLPGLVQSTINAFVLLAYPLIRMYLGLEPKSYESAITATLSRPITYTTYPEFKHITWVKLHRKEYGFEAEPIFGESPMLNVLLKADGYILVEENVRTVKEGEKVQVRLLKGLSSFSFT